MWMTEFDICQRYRQAKNPKNMIGTLADLNAVTKEDITEILIRRGEIRLGGKKTTKRRPLPEGFEQIADRVDKGELTIAEASRSLGLKDSMFRYLKGRLDSERAETRLIEAAAGQQEKKWQQNSE